MITREQLADMLHSVPVAEVARRADVATKTIYRLRHLENPPNMATVEKIIAAVDAIKAEERGRARLHARG